MITHLSAEEIEDYVNRRALRQNVARVDEHLFNCAACYQRFLTIFQAQRRFPIEIDLDDLAGVRGWHLQGEELKAYVTGQMDGLDRVYANLHLKECAWCREEVTHFSEFTSKLEFYLSRRHGPLKSPRTRGKFLDRLGALPTAWSPVRLAGAAALALLVISSLLLWSIRGTNPQGNDIALSAQSPAPIPSGAQATGTTQAVVTPRPETKTKADQVIDSKKIGRGNSPVPAIQASPKGRSVEKSRQEVEASLIAENLAMPSVIETFDRSSVVLRGDDTQIESFNIIGPFRTVIARDQPTFRWTALTGAASYTVSVYDAKLNLIGTSEPLTEPHWTMPSRLERGVIYTWVVTAIKDGKEILAPTLPARAEFKIIEKLALEQLNRRIKQTDSAPVRGVLYAKAGLLDEAERELRAHLHLHPTDEATGKLLRTIKSWREP
jgi:hypothetical protein